MLKGLRTLIVFLPVVVLLFAGCGGDDPTQPENHAPIANAGADLVVALGGTASLAGHGSDEDAGDALTYAWTLVSKPTGSNAIIVNPNQATASLVPDVVGTFVARLTVLDGMATGSDEVTITANPVAANHPPVPNAGVDQTVTVGSTVNLQGSGTDQDPGDVLTYNWTFVSRPAGSAAAFTNGNQATATFVADVAGAYTARLTVSDGKDPRTDDAVITANPVAANHPPVPNAGVDQTVTVGSTVNLQGSGTDQDPGDVLTYNWAFVSRPAGSAAAFTNGNQAAATFVADIAGAYTARLTVSDGKDPRTDDALITANPVAANHPPVPNAGVDQTVTVGSTVNLQGSGTDQDPGDVLTYNWAFVSRPAGSAAAFTNGNQAAATFVADIAGAYTARLTVSDGKDPRTDDAVITANPVAVNHPPVANAGVDQTVTAGDTVILEGSGTDQDPEDVLTFSWAFVSRPAGSAAAFTDGDQAAATFVADVAGAYTARLTVSDGKDPRSDEAVITAAAAPPTPQIIDANITSNRTLTNLFVDPAAVDYLVTGSIFVSANLVIEPGVRIQFVEATGFDIGIAEGSNVGSIRAVGTSALPIIMEGTIATPGHWWGIVIATDDSANELTYVDLFHTGYHDDAGVSVTATGRLKMTHSSVRQGASWGLGAQEGGQLPEFAANTFSGNQQAPVFIPAQLIGSLDSASNYAGGNTRDRVEVFATLVTTDQTWRKLNVPYHVTLQPSIQARVVIQPGTHFLFPNAGGIVVTETGSLKAVGTPADSITFRGDEPIPGHWEGIWIDSNSSENELTYVDVAHCGFNSNANITVNFEDRLKMTHSSSRWGTFSGLSVAENADISGFSSNSFRNNAGPPVEIHAQTIGSLDGNTQYAGGNGQEYILVAGGEVTTAQTWPATDAPFLMLTNSIANLRSPVIIQPGAHFLFEQTTGITVETDGSLRAIGTEEHPITFLGSPPSAGTWFGITVASGDAQNELTHVEIGHCGFQGSANVSLGANAVMTITHSFIHDNSEDCGVRWEETSTYTGSDNTFSGNAGGDECPPPVK
jgi:uncharacterized protein